MTSPLPGRKNPFTEAEELNKEFVESCLLGRNVSGTPTQSSRTSHFSYAVVPAFALQQTLTEYLNLVCSKGKAHVQILLETEMRLAADATDQLQIVFVRFIHHDLDHLERLKITDYSTLLLVYGRTDSQTVEKEIATELARALKKAKKNGLLVAYPVVGHYELKLITTKKLGFQARAPINSSEGSHPGSSGGEAMLSGADATLPSRSNSVAATQPRSSSPVAARWCCFFSSTTAEDIPVITKRKVY